MTGARFFLTCRGLPNADSEARQMVGVSRAKCGKQSRASEKRRETGPEDLGSEEFLVWLQDEVSYIDRTN